jgi:hypothetical protein
MITFSGIPGTFRDLQLLADFNLFVYSSRIFVRFNNDTGTVYSVLNMSATTNSGSTGYRKLSSQTSLQPLTFWTDNFKPTSNIIELYIADYQRTNKFKTILNRSGATNASEDEIALGSAQYAKTNAITEISIFTSQSSRQFQAGSVFSLYGIEG